MKKILSALLIAIIIFVLYQYQKPILSSEEAIAQAYKHLKNPPSETELSLPPIQAGLDGISPENISLSLRQQKGFLNELFNNMQWEVTVIYEDVIPTVVMDAATGEVLDIFGPLN